MRRPFSRYLRFAVALLLAGTTASAKAELTVAGTRHIYPASEKSLTLRVGNSGERPILVQAWLDQGQAMENPSALHVPFSLAPPIFRLDTKQNRALQLRYTGEPLPADRESLFWINFLEVPSLDQARPNLLKLSIRLRMKVLFRPADLPGSPGDAAAKVEWSYRAGQPGISPGALEARNPTPFHVSLAWIEIGPLGASIRMEGLIVPPLATSRHALPAGQQPRAGTTVLRYEFAGDAGELQSGSAPLMVGG